MLFNNALQTYNNSQQLTNALTTFVLHLYLICIIPVLTINDPTNPRLQRGFLIL